MTEQPPDSVGHAVRTTREARGISLRRAAAELGVSPATLSAVERGRTPMTLQRLHELAELLDVPASRLLAGTSPAPLSLRAGEGPGVMGEGRDWRDFSDIEMAPVLEAATRVFVRCGFHGSSMRAVATEAGLSVAGVYHHFPSKQLLLAALVDVTMGEAGWRIAAAREEGRDAVESFALMVEALALFNAVRGDLAFLGTSEMRGLEGAELERVTGLRNQIQYALDDQARLCLEAGEFDCADPHTACRAITSLCTALPSWFRLDGPMSPERVAKQYADYALTLMGARGSLPEQTLSIDTSA